MKNRSPGVNSLRPGQTMLPDEYGLNFVQGMTCYLNQCWLKIYLQNEGPSSKKPKR